MQPAWFQLLHEQKRDRLGLTPSFLVGAMRTPPGEVRDFGSSRTELIGLLESMRDNVSGKHVLITMCNFLYQPVASLREGAYPVMGHAVLLVDGSASKLHAWPDYFARDSHDVESLADGLWDILGPSILGKFSYRGRAWKKFDADDLEFIRRAFSNDKTGGDTDEV